MTNVVSFVLPSPTGHSIGSMHFELVDLLGRDDTEGCFVYINKRLAALLTRLIVDPLNDGHAGPWRVERGFGVFKGQDGAFGDLETARDWFAERLVGASGSAK